MPTQKSKCCCSYFLAFYLNIIRFNCVLFVVSSCLLLHGFLIETE